MTGTTPEPPADDPVRPTAPIPVPVPAPVPIPRHAPAARPFGWVVDPRERLAETAQQQARRRRARAARARKPTRHPALALPATVVFGLLAAFFAWQAAEPLWLALGHGVTGTATVTRCDATDGTTAGRAASGGATYRCVAFEAVGSRFQTVDVTLRGAGDAARAEDATVPARMLGPDRDHAYAANPAGLHLRWSIGLLLVLACGAGISWVTGATRLDERRSRIRAVLLSFAGPLLIAAGFLAAAL